MLGFLNRVPKVNKFPLKPNLTAVRATQPQFILIASKPKHF